MDEAWSDPLSWPGGQLLVGSGWRLSGANPRDQPAFDQDAVDRAFQAMDAPAQQDAHGTPFAPRATAGSPPAADKRERAPAASMPQRSMRIATFAFPPASRSAASTSSGRRSVSSRTMRDARPRSFAFAGMTPTIRPRYVWPSRVNTPVLIMFSVTFCAVPALSRVEPAMTSGPASTSIAMSAAAASGDAGVQVSPTTRAPARRASPTAAST